MTQWISLFLQGSGLLALLVIVFRAGKLQQTVDDIRTNELPHIHEQLKELREAMLK